MTRHESLKTGLIVAAAVVALDQATKWWILEAVMQPPRRIPLTPFFNLVLTWNRGVSFGLFNESGVLSTWGLPLLAVVIVGFLLAWLRTAERRRIALALGLVIGGALGNLIDRLVHGAVVDFLDFHAAGHHWPAFNVADSAITVGAVLLVLDAMLGRVENNKDEIVEK